MKRIILILSVILLLVMSSPPVEPEAVSAFSAPPPPSYYPEIFPDGSGGMFAFWHLQTDRWKQWNIFAQRFDSSGNALWPGDGINIYESDSYQTYPQGVADGEGGAIITWQNYKPQPTNEFEVNAQRLDSTGKIMWGTEGIKLGAGDGMDYTPSYQVISDNDGGIIVVWQRRLGNSGQKIYMLELGNYGIYIQRVDPLGNQIWKPSGVNVTTYVGDSSMVPQIVSDGEGGAIIFWRRQYGDAEAEDKAEVYGQRVDASGQVLWDSPRLVAGSVDTHDPSGLRAVTDGNGGAIVISRNHIFDNNWNWISTVKAQRVNGNGDLLWAENETTIFSNLDLGYYPINVLYDDLGGTIIACMNDENGSIIAQRINASGQNLWKDNGIIVGRPIDYYGYAGNYAVISDNAGGATFTWQRYHNHRSFLSCLPAKSFDESFDVVIQRVDYSGNRLRGIEGEIVDKIEGTGSKMDDNISLIDDGMGNANVIIWEYATWGTSSPQISFIPIPPL
jgi:hypothetical protein